MDTQIAYLRRRITEERLAATTAIGAKARSAHLELSLLYEERLRCLSDRRQTATTLRPVRSNSMPKARLHDEPSSVDAAEGQVVVDGPNGVAVTLTPEAADETGERLIKKAADAAGQRHLIENAQTVDGGEDQTR